ncbi:MAG: glycosyltransferase family 2 protein [Candidatus Nomurabacteria bacterium]|nr:glycosyltransferase family 2 protein [Candidatus Nomurabacteria bacterium]
MESRIFTKIGGDRKLFFSIVIPAHNESLYIENTLNKIGLLEYPKDLYEVIVIENGSKDDTYNIAKKFESENTYIFTSSKKGVSPAKNLGIEKISPKSEWTVFLDADTVLEKYFLSNLNNFLIKDIDGIYSVGTTKINPIPFSKKAQRWFTFYDLGHKFTKTSYAIQIIKTSLLDRVHFHEHLDMGEDLKFIDEARKFGKFFFLETNEVYTSTRRFEKEGWWHLFLYWNFVALLPDSLKRRFIYKVVR